MIKISLKGLAKYMTSSPAKQRKVLQDFKYPQEDEPYAMRLYYQDALERIKAFHKNGHEVDWLIQQSNDLSQLANLTGGQSGVRLRNNSRTLRLYADNFSDREFVILKDLRLFLRFSGVRISVVPDLHIREGSKEKIIKFDFTSTSPNSDTVKIISQCMYEAAREVVIDLTSTSVLYIEVSSGIMHKGARAGARMLNEIEAACETISTLWDSIPAPHSKAILNQIS